MKGTPIMNILNSTGWKSDKTFYKLPIDNDENFGSAVLEQSNV